MHARLLIIKPARLIPILLAIPFLFFTSCGERTKTSGATPAQHAGLDSLFQEYYQFKKRINPLEATKAGDSIYNDQLANYISDDYQQDLIANYTHFLEELKRFRNSEITATQGLSKAVMEWDCNIKREGLTNNLVTIASPMYDLPTFELMPLLQIQSLHLYFSQVAAGNSVQPFRTPKDYENWLNRVDAYLPFLDTCMLKMKEGMAKGVVLPKVLILKMLPQLESFEAREPEDHIFYQPVRNMPENFSPEVKQRLSRAYSDMLVQKLIPKYRELSGFLKDTYLPAGRETSGIGALPHGPETYQYLIRLHTTTNMTADEIHNLGKSEVNRIRGEMEKAMSETGYKGDLKEFLISARERKELMPYTEPAQVIQSFYTIRDRLQPRLKEVFSSNPRASFEVRRTEAYRESSASAEYVPGTKDASRPGTFYVPIPDVRTYNRISDEALFLHEAVPGHHYQLSLQQENKDLPEFLHPESMGVFVEGWALYAESLGKEMGLYGDPYQYFGMLSMEMHRAIRLVVDTGLHAKGWTREEAIRYSLENEAESEADIIVEIERYMATPGQALSYKVGQLKIRGLRNKAEAELGKLFDIREFHDQVLNTGSLPLLLLEEKIESWIAGRKAG